MNVTPVGQPLGHRRGRKVDCGLEGVGIKYSAPTKSEGSGPAFADQASAGTPLLHFLLPKPPAHFLLILQHFICV